MQALQQRQSSAAAIYKIPYQPTTRIKETDVLLLGTSVTLQMMMNSFCPQYAVLDCQNTLLPPLRRSSTHHLLLHQ